MKRPQAPGAGCRAPGAGPQSGAGSAAASIGSAIIRVHIPHTTFTCMHAREAHIRAGVYLVIHIYKGKERARAGGRACACVFRGLWQSGRMTGLTDSYGRMAENLCMPRRLGCRSHTGAY